MTAFAYTVAKQKGYADIGLVTIRSGADRYGFQIIAHVDSAFTPSDDPATALAQLKDKKPCWVDTVDASGYVLPMGFFGKYEVPIKSGNAAAFVGGHPAVVRAVYAKGICDFGATFVDARTSPAIQKDLPDAMDQVMVVYTSEPFIPKDTVSFPPDLPAEVRAKIVEALLKIAETQDGKKALKTVFQIDGLKAADDTLFDELRVYLEASGLDVATLFK
ncbi:MAG: PhnD/SsuA/transferrin family substrate-binding protein [Chloroflexi bacterium]|nr:PhnD/SsuA/transferrin family substrate-binding protein [Chloroflexota bacterium]